ncbi:hypothetical protein N7481_011924 [Penicillium waksmanii]|uniref:uncharacterized protein n=1 Tax=Penicillium waksmanii TaxID=69791 RepID=UPI002547DB2B|nr:uncharacterized protein N7481_011924 [Penicillium waksmanii]KAJ5974714.1 hypothetical protein N7481_011924 [Penicillium waksmanii]
MPPARARRACTFCNGRRIKCNVTESMPCHNCVAANVECHVRESGRGKWPRQPKVPKTGKEVSPQAGVHAETDCSILSTAQESSTGHAQSAEGGPLDQPTFLCQDNEVYLGESTLLGAVHSTRPEPRFHRSIKPSLRYPLPAIAAIPEWEHQRRKRRLETLAAEGAMTLPEKSVQNVLSKAYFEWFHACFPVVDKKTALDQSGQSRGGDISPMLFQAMMFIGVIHCNAEQLKEVGLGTGEEARHLFYNRAKDLHDADVESNSLIQLQTMFLLSFWRAGPLLQKDCRYWLGSAITLAQKKGMHRLFNSVDPNQMRLRKRIWWSIYVRERQCAAALGLPNRIRDEDCDIAPLTTEDFNNPESTQSPSTAFGLVETNYVIEMATLARFLGKIVCREYTPNSNHSPLGRTYLRSELNAWYQQLPDCLRLDNKGGGLLVGMLHMAHNNLLILLSRRAFIAEAHESNRDESQIAYQAACQISRIAEDLLAEDLLGHGQIHLITCLFNALCIHTVNLRRVKGTSRLVAEHRAKICLYGLRELQKTWEVTNWILQLFFQHLDRSAAQLLETKWREDDDNQAILPSDGHTVSSDHPKLSPMESLVEPTELGLNMPFPWPSGQDNVFLTGHEGQDESWINAFSCLDGITPVDLELLAGCLT